MTDHLAALLGLEAPADLTLIERMEEGANLAHIVMHNTSGVVGRFDADTIVERFRGLPSFVKSDVLVGPALEVDPGGILGRFILRAQITETGRTLFSDFAEIVAQSDYARPSRSVHAPVTPPLPRSATSVPSGA